jgi:anti-anti-sigma factor
MCTTHSPVTASTSLHITTMINTPPGTARVAVTGEVDLATAPEFRDAMLGLLRTRDPSILDIDLAGVTFLDCTGISALVAVRNAAIDAGCHVRVRHPQPIVGRVLEVTGLLDVLTVEPQRLPPDPEHPPGPVPPSVSARHRLLAACAAPGQTCPPLRPRCGRANRRLVRTASPRRADGRNDRNARVPFDDSRGRPGWAFRWDGRRPLPAATARCHRRWPGRGRTGAGYGCGRYCAAG